MEIFRDITGKLCKITHYDKYSTYEGAYPDIQVNIIRTLPLNRWLLALERTLEIVKTEELVLDDSDEIGNKHTHCNWGMCGNSLKQWPDAQDHIWPLRFENIKLPAFIRVAPLNIPDGQSCPLDFGGKHGCFYHCMAFQRTKQTTRDKVIRLYENKILEVSQEIGYTVFN